MVILSIWTVPPATPQARASTSVSRTDHPPSLAAKSALGWAQVMLERLRHILWLTTGVLPAGGDTYVLEQSNFPSAPIECFPASQRETFSHLMGGDTAVVDGPLLADVLRRFDAVNGDAADTFPEDIVEPLGMAWRYAVPALESPDSRMTLLLCHAALDGLLRLLGEGCCSYPESRCSSKGA